MISHGDHLHTNKHAKKTTLSKRRLKPPINIINMSSNKETNKMEPRDDQNYRPTQDGEKEIVVDVVCPEVTQTTPKSVLTEKRA